MNKVLQVVKVVKVVTVTTVMLLLFRVNRSLFHPLKLMKTKLIHLQSSKKEVQDINALPSFLLMITMSLK